MVLVPIQGMVDGTRTIDLAVTVDEVDGLSSDFVGTVVVEGAISRHGNRFTIAAELRATARLVCDRSLEVYDEAMVVDLDLAVVVDTALALQQQGMELADDDVLAIRDDDKAIDVTDVIRQELVVHLPMRRIAPAYRDKDFDALFPERASTDDATPSSDDVDDRWAALKRLRNP